MEEKFKNAVFQFHLNGFDVYSDPSLTMIEKGVVKIPLRIRLFSWPWRPFKAWYEVKFAVADDKVYKWEVDGLIRLVAHPHTVREMSRQIFDSANLDAPPEEN